MFDPHCTRCPRLAAFLAEQRQLLPGYHGLPVAPYGVTQPRLLVVGLAPGLHGANRTGRPFTGDHAGLLLYATLHRFGFANQPTSTAQDDGHALLGCRISNAVKCVPPQNKPTPLEIRTCNPFLRDELLELAAPTAILALGTIAHAAVLQGLQLKARDYAFGHGHTHDLPGIGHRLFDSYHCSRYNTQTRRLTETMFQQVFADITAWLAQARPTP